MYSRVTLRKLQLAFFPLIATPLLFFGKGNSKQLQTPRKKVRTRHTLIVSSIFAEYRCLFGIIFLSSYWIGDVLPIGITSLLPLALFPILHVVPSKEISPVYFKDSIVLFICTLIMAMAVESSGLHRRIALKLLTKVGATQPIMLLGFMGITSFISFFVSDTACTALMCPTACALLLSIREAKNRLDEKELEENSISAEASIAEKLRISEMSQTDAGFCRALILACAHASLIGGTAIITSTGPNLVFRENIQKSYPDGQVTMTYLQWMTFAIPPMFIYLLASYFVLISYFMGPKTLLNWFEKPNCEQVELNRAIEKNILTMYQNLGAISFSEISVFISFALLIFLWISRDPGFSPGWADLLEHRDYLTDSVTGVIIASIMFIWPKDPFNKKNPTEPILKWCDMKTRFSWSCTLLIGAGYAISEAVDKSGLSHTISCSMSNLLDGMNPFPLQLLITTTIVILTEFASNVSTGSIFIPITLAISESITIHPLYLSLPTTVACSFAFMLPISTPPNAIVYDTKVVSMIDMIFCGFLLNILCILITSLNMNTWTYWIFNLSSFPEGINNKTNTISC